MEQNFKILIKPKSSWRDINFKELWAYRDLILLFVKRNFITRYKQTILGPAWLFITPIISTFISTFVFGTIAEIPSDGVPYFLFYMCGYTAWSYFSSCLTSTSSTFTGNAAIFGKVYFPRLVMPISTVITGLLNLFIQMGIFIGFWIYYRVAGAQISMTWMIMLFPILVIQMASLGLGIGIIISSLTTKYRDLTVLVGFGVNLWMYVTPIIYSSSTLAPKLRAIIQLNPMTPVIDIMRSAFLGTGEVSWIHWGISWGVTVIVLMIGVALFNKIEKTFMDTV